jgi:hypothetical protein
MALVSPIAAADFADLLAIKKCTFLPSWGKEFSGQGSGVIRDKNLRPTLWDAEVELAPRCWDDADSVMAQLEVFYERGITFHLYDPRRRNPIWGAVDDSTVQIRTLGADGKSLSLKGAQPDSVVTAGDMLAYWYGGSSGVDASRALHRVVETQPVDGLGQTLEFEIVPGLPVGVAVDDDVQLLNPSGIFHILPPGPRRESGERVDVVRFQARQVI